MKTLNQVFKELNIQTITKMVKEYYSGDGMRGDDNIRYTIMEVTFVTKLTIPDELKKYEAKLNKAVGLESFEARSIISEVLREHYLRPYAGKEIMAKNHFGEVEKHVINDSLEVVDSYGNPLFNLPWDWPVGDMEWLKDRIETFYEEEFDE